MITVGLVSCSRQKAKFGPCAARYLYTSQLFRKSLDWAEQNCDRVFILSARHGLLTLDARVEPYDQTVAQLSQGERIIWARKARNALAGELRELGHSLRACPIILLAGKTYAEPFVRELDPSTRVEQPLAGMMIGTRLSWLTKRLAQEQLFPMKAP